jgi:UDP-N-acetyl-D-glucosamine dehydrogenase
LTPNFEPDLTCVVQAAKAIARSLRAAQIVILESTTYPGTTSEVVKPLITCRGLEVGKDIFLAYSPEREDPGNFDFPTTRIPKVVGADDPTSLEIAVALYDAFAPSTVAVSSAATAEAVKITENVFRAVNIALVNELKIVFDAMGINVWEVIETAKTKPFGFMPFYPGPGPGGHCIPIDPFYLIWKAREFGQTPRLVEVASQVNSSMPERVVQILSESIDARLGKELKNSRILVLGIAYKKNADDIRESPSLRVLEMIEECGAIAEFHDPHVAQINSPLRYPSLNRRESVPWNLTKFAAYDAVLIATDHDGLDYLGLAGAVRLIVDTRNVCARAGADLKNVVRA